MARSSRQQRRARRAQTQPALAGVPPTPPPSRPRPTASGSDEPSRRPQQRTTRERRIPFSGTAHFLQESYGELKKVEWPNQKAVVSGTAVVMIACTIVGTYLWLNDRLWQYVVHHLLLR